MSDEMKTGLRHHPHLQNIHPYSEIGNACTIHAFVWIGEGVKIGKNCKIQAFAFIPNGVTLMDNVFVGPHVCFTNDIYPRVETYGEMAETVVEEGANIGANATIIAGVRIGRGATVGAGAVVTKNVRAGTTVVGNPARELHKEEVKQYEVGC